MNKDYPDEQLEMQHGFYITTKENNDMDEETIKYCLDILKSCHKTDGFRRGKAKKILKVIGFGYCSVCGLLPIDMFFKVNQAYCILHWRLRNKDAAIKAKAINDKSKLSLIAKKTYTNRQCHCLKRLKQCNHFECLFLSENSVLFPRPKINTPILNFVTLPEHEKLYRSVIVKTK